MEEFALPNPLDQFLEAFHDDRLEEARALAAELHAADLAGMYEQLSVEERPALIKLVATEEFAEFVHQLPLQDAAGILRDLPDGSRASLLEELPDDTVVDLLQEMDTTQRGHLFHLLSEDRRKAARRLLRFPDDSAGGRMTTAFASVREDLTVREAITELMKVKDETEVLARIYVVDVIGHILGKVRLRDLTFAAPEVLIADINDHDTRAVLALTDQEKAVRVMQKYDLLTLPVVDEEGRLLGVITHDDALDIQEAESTEDLERQSGIAGETPDATYLNTPVLHHVRRRIGWIVSLAFFGLIAGYLIYSFQAVLGSVFVLSIYMPMVVAAGGNTGGQAATMVIRAMSIGELHPQEFLRVAAKEVRVGLLVGAVAGICMAIQIQWFMPAGTVLPPGITLEKFALVVGLSLLCQITASTLIGATLPIAAKVARLDPAVMSSPAITSMVDATGLVIYFNLAKAILRVG
jgi:magnesium transporter